MESFKVFTELSKFLDRNFLVAYLSPAIIFLFLNNAIFEWLGLMPDVSVSNISILDTSIDEILLIGGLALLLAASIGIILSALNQEFYRLFEGYGAYNPLKLFGWMERRRFRRIVDEVERLDNEYRECIMLNKDFPKKSTLRRNTLMRQLAEEFPDQEEYLLPTPFGNVIRSFEIYSRYMYGLEAVDGWARLLAVIPKDYLEHTNNARAKVDFWVNLGIIFALLQIEYIMLAFVTGTSLKWWVVLLFIWLGTIAPLRATGAAIEWGDFVKSAFDVYRFKLLEALGIDLPKTREGEKKLWTKYSQAIIYRLPETLPSLKKETTSSKKNNSNKTK
jgi:hypothetical protein